MHTARQLAAADFVIRIDDRPAAVEDLLPHWNPWDRLGIVVDQPFGGLGANALIQLAITAFYDSRPARRAGFPTREQPESELAIYPEIYVFHVGGRHGFYAAYDFWPARKEVFLPADPRVVLDAINDRGISRLLVPDSPARPVEHEYKEPASARDRITSAFVYGAIGRAEGADVEITASRPVTQANAKQVLAGSEQSGNLQARVQVSDDPDLQARHYTSHAARRAGEGRDHVAAVRENRAALKVDGAVVETYRRIDVDTALGHLTGRLDRVSAGS
jgi:hypothetical protein